MLPFTLTVQIGNDLTVCSKASKACTYICCSICDCVTTKLVAVYVLQLRGVLSANLTLLKPVVQTAKKMKQHKSGKRIQNPSRACLESLPVIFIDLPANSKHLLEAPAATIKCTYMASVAMKVLLR